MRTLTLDFSGSLLERGFWLYAWRIAGPGKVLVYIGRTGDSSSINASSPFNRAGQHLDLRPTAPANMLVRRLRQAGVDPTKCHFTLVALGPIHRETKTLHTHRRRRDQLGALEVAIAERLRTRGYDVLGAHHSRIPPDNRLLASVAASLNKHFPTRRRRDA